MLTIKELLNSIPQIGLLEWIGLRTEKHQEVISVNDANLVEGIGIDGDHRTKRPESKTGGKRQVTLLQFEYLPVIASIMKEEQIDPRLLRRNLLVSGINLLSLKNQRFSIGEVILEGTGECHPCSRMEENLGCGGYNAMRGHGGITAKIILGGIIKTGDKVKFI